MNFHHFPRHSSAPRNIRRIAARILAVLALVASFTLVGGLARADISDHTGHVFHNQLLCDSAPFARSTRLVGWRVDNKPAGVYLTLRNTDTGVVLQSDVAGAPSSEDIPGHVLWNWTWIRAGDQAVYGSDEAWVTYIWPDGSSSWEQLTDVGSYPGGSINGNTICVL